jgi:hypothetical protein
MKLFTPTFDDNLFSIKGKKLCNNSKNKCDNCIVTIYRKKTNLPYNSETYCFDIYKLLMNDKINIWKTL